jgi:Uma2 family endonuclease
MPDIQDPRQLSAPQAPPALVAPPHEPVADVPLIVGSSQRFVLDGVGWPSYVTISDALPDRPRLRITFDRGRLEFMTTSSTHEILKKWLSRLIETLAEECALPWTSAGHMTFQRPELERGLEPDDCYWIAHEARMRGRLEYNAVNDPPPDLVLEIEVSRSALNRMGIYAAMGVPEVWRFDREGLHIHGLQADHTYAEIDQSLSFPRIRPSEMRPFWQPDPARDVLTILREFRSWVRQQLAAPPAPPSPQP